MEGVDRGESTGEARGEMRGEASSVATRWRASCKASGKPRDLGVWVTHTHPWVVWSAQRRQDVVVMMVWGELDILVGMVGFGWFSRG